MRNHSVGLWVSLLLVILSPITSRSDELAGLDLEAFEGKVLVVDFWASWCVPCRRSFPWFNDMQSKYGSQGLVIIGVNLDNDLEAATDDHIYFSKEASSGGRGFGSGGCGCN